jgi:hypothetical protein
MSGNLKLPSVDRRIRGRMALILSQFMSDANAKRLMRAFHVVLTGCVFTFLAMMILLS